jgi:23S rRNA (adenine1618-N6)-methyltransferase
LPFPTSYPITLPSSVDPEAAKDAITTQLSSLDLKWSWNAENSTGIGEASQNVWSRNYRRAYERKQRDGLVDMKQDSERKIELAFRIRVIDLAREVVVEWLRGTDQVLWESLCGLVHRHFKKS